MEFRKGTICEGCPIYHKYGLEDFVPYEIVGESPEVIVVGEAPGNEEVVQKRPFIGPSGQLLRSALEEAGIKSYIIANTVMCRPRSLKSDGSMTFRTPEWSEIKTCSQHIREFINLNKDKINKVILAGGVA